MSETEQDEPKDEGAYYCFDCERRVTGFGHDCDEEPSGDQRGIVMLSKEGDDLVAVPDDMGHYTPHMWIEVDYGEVCTECGARLVERDSDFDVVAEVYDD